MTQVPHPGFKLHGQKDALWEVIDSRSPKLASKFFNNNQGQWKSLSPLLLKFHFWGPTPESLISGSPSRAPHTCQRLLGVGSGQAPPHRVNPWNSNVTPDLGQALWTMGLPRAHVSRRAQSWKASLMVSSDSERRKGSWTKMGREYERPLQTLWLGSQLRFTPLSGALARQAINPGERSRKAAAAPGNSGSSGRSPRSLGGSRLFTRSTETEMFYQLQNLELRESWGALKRSLPRAVADLVSHLGFQHSWNVFRQKIPSMLTLIRSFKLLISSKKL